MSVFIVPGKEESFKKEEAVKEVKIQLPAPAPGKKRVLSVSREPPTAIVWEDRKPLAKTDEEYWGEDTDTIEAIAFVLFAINGMVNSDVDLDVLRLELIKVLFWIYNKATYTLYMGN